MSAGEIGCTLASTREHQQLLFEKKILGQDSFDAAGAEELSEGGQEGS